MTGVVIDCHDANAKFHFRMAFWHFLLSEEHTVALLRPDVATAKEYVRCVYKVRCSPMHTHNDARAQHTHPPTHTHTHTPTHTRVKRGWCRRERTAFSRVFFKELKINCCAVQSIETTILRGTGTYTCR